MSALNDFFDLAIIAGRNLDTLSKEMTAFGNNLAALQKEDPCTTTFLEKLVAGTIDNSDPRLSSENVFDRKTYATRNIQHLKRLMSQTWFTDALDIDQFMKINDAIVAGETYIG